MGEENANTTFRIFSFSNYPNITFHKDHHNTAAEKTILFHRRRKHGMGLLGKVMRKKRLTRRMPESSRKRKLGGNSRDHRPYFTYWVTFVQAAILFISLLLYGFGPLGVDLYKRSNMVSILSSIPSSIVLIIRQVPTKFHKSSLTVLCRC